MEPPVIAHTLPLARSSFCIWRLTASLPPHSGDDRGILRPNALWCCFAAPRPGGVGIISWDSLFLTFLVPDIPWGVFPPGSATLRAPENRHRKPASDAGIPPFAAARTCGSRINRLLTPVFVSVNKRSNLSTRLWRSLKRKDPIDREMESP